MSNIGALNSSGAAMLLLGSLLGSTAFAQANLRILLPERTRLLQGQQVDLVLEVRNAASVSGLKVTAGSVDLTSKFSAPQSAQLDCDATTDWVLRADLQSIEETGSITLTATANAAGAVVSDSRILQVRPFNIPSSGKRNVILFIGDAMGTAYRDAARLVSRAIVDDKGKNSFREGSFDNLLEMDKMPISGMSMTYGSDSIVPDSANTGTAWATGNKSFLNAINTFTDGTDCRWRFNGAANASNLPYILDNPRVENLWQYLKRRYGYRTGIVTTADVTDATPAVQGSYSGYRQTRFEIARQYIENPMLKGIPAFDVILGGGTDQFMPTVRTDGRNLIQEFLNKGYRYVTTASELNKLRYESQVLGLFRASSANPRAGSDGLKSSVDPNMDVAYDKLGLPRPASEPAANLGAFTDQPMLEDMTAKAIEFLTSSFTGNPFILMVEGASIDKQSHPNHQAGTIWDTIELDRSVGVARAFAAKRATKDTLVVVTADHDQSMSIIGVSNIPDTEYFNRDKKETLAIKTTRGDQGFTVFGDSYSNARAAYPFVNSSNGADINSGATAMPGTFAVSSDPTDPASPTYSTYFGSTAYPKDAKTGYPVNTVAPGKTLRRLAVGFRTGDHTGSSVPVTAEGPGAFLFTGYMEQTDIFFKIATSLTGDTTEGDRFVDQILLNDRYPKTFGK